MQAMKICPACDHPEHEEECRVIIDRHLYCGCLLMPKDTFVKKYVKPAFERWFGRLDTGSVK